MKKRKEKERAKKQEKASARDTYADSEDEKEREKETKNLGKIDQDIEDITEEISKLAYQFFVDRNYLHGYDFNDWLNAEKIIKKRLRISEEEK